MGGGPTDGPELGGQWKGWGDGVMSALLCLDSSIRILRAATGKMRKPFGHDLGVGGRKRGKLQVMPRFQAGGQLFGAAAGRALAAVLSAGQPAPFWEDKGPGNPRALSTRIFSGLSWISP